MPVSSIYISGGSEEYVLCIRGLFYRYLWRLKRLEKRIVDLSKILLAELASRIKKSDSEALAEVYRRLNRPLIAYIQRFSKDTETSYDILQDVFMKLWEHRHTMRDETHLKALLYTMARNRSLNVSRKDSRQVAVEPGELAETRAHEQSALDAIELKGLQRKVEEWVGTLPPRRAEAFMLSRFHNLRYSEVAEIMNLSERTVQTHVLHALKDLRSKLAKYRQEL